MGYTDYQAKVAAIQSRIIDEAMDLTAKHPSFRFSTEASGTSGNISTRTPQEKRRVIAAIQHELYIPAQYGNVYGLPDCRNPHPFPLSSANFSRTYDATQFRNIADVPSCTWSYHRFFQQLGLSISSREATTTALLFCCKVI